VNGNQILTILVLSLFILSVVFFSIENPYWYISILTFTIAILICMIKAMWGFSGWINEKLE